MIDFNNPKKAQIDMKFAGTTTTSHVYIADDMINIEDSVLQTLYVNHYGKTENPTKHVSVTIEFLD